MILCKIYWNITSKMQLNEYPIHLTFAGLAASISRNVSQFRSFRAGRASTPRAMYTNAPQITAVDTIVRTSRGVSKGVSI